MKLLLGTLILGAAASTFGQDAAPAAPALPAVPPAPAVAPRAAILPVLAPDIAIVGTTKNAPFTADESGETVKIMPDGNRIVQGWTGRIARNSDGKIRRDITSGKVGDGAARPMIMGAGPLTTIAIGGGDSPMVWSKVDAENAAARSLLVTTAPGAPLADENRVYVLKAEAAAAKELAVVAAAGAARVAAEADLVRVALPTRIEDGKFQTRRESLGTRDFSGVQAEGTRVTTTIAAGALGNEREIEVVSETWVSKELGVVVYSKRTDPRTGETTYQMTNITRAEPDASLFPGR